MKTTLNNRLAWVSSLLFAALSADLALAQSRFAPYSGKWDKSGASDDSGQTSAAVVSGPILRVSKTAFVDGHEVCGVIRITNSGGQAATITGIADTLEVHFPRGATPPVPPPPGSTASWFKVADVPIEFALPASITPGATTTIPYCFSLCLATDSPGANSMRNVVTISATNASGSLKTFTTRSLSFPPPTLDCQACCKLDGTCSETVPDDCAAAGGAAKGSGTDCATTECTQACCRDGICNDEILSACQSGGEALGLGTECATTECPRGCCYSDGSCEDLPPSVCVAGGGRPHEPGSRCRDTLGCTQACCLLEGGCVDRVPPFCGPLMGVLQGPGTECATTECPEGCCYSDGSCEDQPPSVCVAGGGRPHEPGSRCRDTLGCTQACCLLEGGCVDRVPPFCGPLTGVLQGPGTECATTECCVPFGIPSSCSVSADCCGGNSICSGGTCCVGPGNIGCKNGSDCCDYFGVFTLGCEAGTGRCCNVIGGPCNANEHCCDPNAGCDLSRNTCCIFPPGSGCTGDSDCCFLTCNSGKCCARLGDFCTGTDSYCCNTNAICGSENVCCLPVFRSCTADSDCCSGLVCTGGVCDRLIGP